MRYSVPSIAAFRRIRTAANSPRPSGTPLINAGGKGTVLIFDSFVVASAEQEIATACGLAMTVVVGGGDPSVRQFGPRPAAFTKISVYFLCKVCYTMVSVRRDGQTRADIERKYAICCGQKDHLPDDSGSKGVALAA